MDVVFSEKYQPLFDLLTCWDDYKQLDKLIRSGKKLSDSQKKQYEYLSNLKTVDTVLLSGGRDSGKTFALSTFNVIACHDFNHRILYTRQTMSSTDHSISAALNERMTLLDLESNYEYANNNYTLKDKTKKGKITITGQKTSTGTQTAKLKSLEDYSIFVTDEGEELISFDEWKKVKRSMRAKDVQCLSIISFNPPSIDHWMAKEFYESIPNGFNGIKGNTLYIHTTYIDNGKENMAEHNWNEYEELRKHYDILQKTPSNQISTLPESIIKKASEYKYKIIGSFKEKAEGTIYNYTTAPFPTHLPYNFGLDFGSEDPDALVKIAIDRKAKKAYIKEMLYQNNLNTDQLTKILKVTCGNKIIVADSAGKRTIGDLRDANLNVWKAFKKSIVDEIKQVWNYELIIDPESYNLVKELNNYVWLDKKSETPIDAYNHLLDAMRYYIIWYIRNS